MIALNCAAIFVGTLILSWNAKLGQRWKTVESMYFGVNRGWLMWVWKVAITLILSNAIKDIAWFKWVCLGSLTLVRHYIFFSDATEIVMLNWKCHFDQLWILVGCIRGPFWKRGLLNRICVVISSSSTSTKLHELKYVFMLIFHVKANWMFVKHTKYHWQWQWKWKWQQLWSGKCEWKWHFLS